jgi:single-stranded DNA-binding protein
MGVLKYTPSGSAVCEFTMAVPQIYFDKLTIGYFEVLLLGKSAENYRLLKIGQKITLKGSLWARSFKNRLGQKVNETKVLVESIEGESNEENRRT